MKLRNVSKGACPYLNAMDRPPVPYSELAGHNRALIDNLSRVSAFRSEDYVRSVMADDEQTILNVLHICRMKFRNFKTGA